MLYDTKLAEREITTQDNVILSNMVEGAFTTVVFDNIDFDEHTPTGHQY